LDWALFGVTVTVATVIVKAAVVPVANT